MPNSAQKIKASTQKFTEIVDILDDVVILDGGNAAQVIEVTASNFALLSGAEQQAKIFSYASLLNSLSFSIQIVVKNKQVDISSYLKSLDDQAKTTKNEMLSLHIQLYRDFVQELVKVNTVLDKKFYIVVPYSYLEGGVKGAAKNAKKNSTEELAKDAKKALDTKTSSVLTQLARLGLPAVILEKEELIKLFYGIFNQDLSETSQISDDIKAPIIRAAQKT